MLKQLTYLTCSIAGMYEGFAPKALHNIITSSTWEAGLDASKKETTNSAIRSNEHTTYYLEFSEVGAGELNDHHEENEICYSIKQWKEPK